MKMKNLALASAATLALAGTLGMSTLSFAQSSDRQPQFSSPAEVQATSTLNQQQANGTYTSAAVLNGGTAPASTTVDMQPITTSAADEQNTALPPDQQVHYRDLAVSDDRVVRHYDTAQWDYADYPREYRYRYEDGDLQRLYLIAEPAQQLANAPVEGPNGKWVGKVRNVETDVDGRPKRVEISLNRRVSVWVDPGDLRFDSQDKILYTDLTRDQLWDMPGATVESGM
jgi:hypothetical protein